jgi:hypothetical protein
LQHRDESRSDRIGRFGKSRDRPHRFERPAA